MSCFSGCPPFGRRRDRLHSAVIPNLHALMDEKSLDAVILTSLHNDYTGFFCPPFGGCTLRSSRGGASLH